MAFQELNALAGSNLRDVIRGQGNSYGIALFQHLTNDIVQHSSIVAKVVFLMTPTSLTFGRSSESCKPPTIHSLNRMIAISRISFPN